MLNSEEKNPYAINIENKPIITTNITSSNTSSQTNVQLSQEVRNNIMEMQGDIAELQEELENGANEELSSIQQQLETIKKDLSMIENLNSTEEVVKSGKLNKLKRFLQNISDENSDERKALSGIKNIGAIIGGLLTKFNFIADKIGISKLPI